jgi:amino acid transporter
VGNLSKRVLVGRKMRSSQLGETLLPKRIALPVFGSDPLSSVAYSPDEIFLTLSLSGLAAYTFSWKIAIVIGIVMLAVVTSYRQNAQTYTSGGGSYEVTRVNLGATAGLVVASALQVDYILTVSVSIASAAQYAATGIPALQAHQVAVAVAATLFLMAMNLRGVRESGTAFALPTYLFIVSLGGLLLLGFARHFFGHLPAASTADLNVIPGEGMQAGIGGLAGSFLLLRAFSSGCATLTGVEAISNGVPAFRKPKGKNAAATLLILGLMGVTFALGVVTLANLTHVRIAEDPATQLIRPDGTPVGGSFHQDPIITQLAHSVFSDFSPGFYLMTASTGILLMLAANTAFNGFPVLGSLLASDGYLPRQLASRGDRLAFSNGIFLLTAAAIVLIVALDAEVTRLIQLYIIGVFVSFTFSQTGMVRHWTRLLKSERDPAARAKMQTSRVISGFGLTVTALVLVVVMVTKFTHGAWISIVAMGVLFLIMKIIRRHYDNVALELTAEEGDKVLPTRVHAIVLVSKLHKAALRALAFAKASRPNTLEGVYVSVDPLETGRLLEEWDRENTGVPLKTLYSPYREIIGPIVEYASSIRRTSPRSVVAVYIPEYVVGRWWEHFLHNQTALRLKGRLLFTPGVMVISVPYQLRSSKIALEREEREEHRVQPGDLRRGRVAEDPNRPLAGSTDR